MSKTNYVLVVDTNKHPLSPCKPGVARSLLKAGKAAVFRRYPFTIILKKEVEGDILKSQIKIDPGSKTTGLALVQNGVVIWAAELQHRGQLIKQSLDNRRSLRRNRRNRKTRYRQPRFLNRVKSKPKGWLAPSLMHRVENVSTWVNKLIKFSAVDSVMMELVRFDTQKMTNPDVSGVQYQQGELTGYEVREYLLEKFDRTCVYCQAKNVPLEVEHIQPKSKGGSNRISNLTLACRPCNQSKGNQDIQDFLSGKPSLLKRILNQAKQPLKDAAAVNSTRWKLKESLELTGLPVFTGNGALTKYNRCRLGLPKTHWLDAASVGEIDNLVIATHQPLLIKSFGFGSRQMCRTDKYGFPTRHCSRQKVHFGFTTGDIVKADIPKGKYAGKYTARVTVRSTGSFAIKSLTHGKQIDVNHKYCKAIHKLDGYGYGFGELININPTKLNPVETQIVKGRIAANPTQLNLFDSSIFAVESSESKIHKKQKVKGDDYEQLSLF
ncbi:RNA-guided endonuclease IscB [Laspinema olomoucense]|uniref:RNA-guided endonuclease IscB n=1 Tax=Laspinema olomoucense TaxID=3231600 RepID=UPI0021BA4E9C|nr:RNA-guided endonuclease IscB [Laspinema sp. D3c]MCT7992492.1 RNA-guided endonuclease IscB [Laspinema sp. D3c]